MKLKALSFFLVFIFLLLFISWKYLRYSFKRRLILPLNLNKRWVYFYDLSFVFIVFFRSVYRLQWDMFKEPIWSKIFYADLFLFGWLGFISILLCSWDIFDFIKTKISHKNVDEEFSIDRRSFLKKNIPLFAMSGVSIGTSVAAALECRECHIKHVEIKLDSFPKRISGLKIAQITDLHIGSTIKGDYLEDIVKKINKAQVDIVILTGDMVDGTVDFLKDELQSLKLLNARYGVYFVTGNHEYYWGAMSWIQFYTDLGITVLNNEHKIVDIHGIDFLIGGVTDYQADRFYKDHKSDPKKAMGNMKDEVDFRLLLAHRPKSCVKAEKAGFDLQLSGHTHGGQSFPYTLIVGLIQKHLKGFYWHKKMALYVSSGAGYWGPPVRLGVPAESCIYTLSNTESV